jgi:YD repeat-containing protein
VGSSDGQTFEYDDRGNLTGLDGWQHRYDPRNRLVESVREDGTRVSTVYDYTGARVQTVEQPPHLVL